MIFEAARSENPRRTASYGEGLNDVGNEEDRNTQEASILLQRQTLFASYQDVSRQDPKVFFY